MEENSEFDSIKNSQNEHKNIIRVIFLNLLINAFIIMCYFYLSEIFGSISTIFIENSRVYIHFGVVLLIFTIFSILAGYYHGFIAGFLGELLFQLAYYDTIYLNWCLIIAIWGFICGLYKYRPLRYQEKINILFHSIILFGSSLILVVIIIITKLSFGTQQSDIETIMLTYGIKFFVQTFLLIVIIVPFILFFYDSALGVKERHLYYIPFTHHPISMSDHTFHLTFGKTSIYFCSRCSGVIIGGIIAFFFTQLIEKIYDIEFPPELAVLLCIILPIPGLIDWGTQRMLLRTSTTKSRLLTGFIIGNALHFISLTKDYYYFIIFLLVLYFSILGLLMYFGHKKEMSMLRAENNEEDVYIVQ